MSSMPRALQRPRYILLLLGGLLTSLSGCLRYTEALTIHPDDTVSGVIVLAAREPEPGGTASPPAQASDLTMPMPQSSSESIRVAPFRHDRETGYKVTFSRARFAEVAAFSPLNANGGALVVNRSGDELQIAMTIDLSHVTSQTERAYVEAHADLTVAVTVPGGTVTATDGALAGDTITWHLVPFQVNTLSATVEAPVGRPSATGARSIDPVRGVVLGTSIIAALALGWLLLRPRLLGDSAPERAAHRAEPPVRTYAPHRATRARDPWPASMTAPQPPGASGERYPAAAPNEQPSRVRPVHEMLPERETGGGGRPPERPGWKEHR